MKFSIGTLLAVMAFCAVVLAITFTLQSAFGLLLMTFLTLVVLPPVIQVGAFTTRGLTQGFFIGTAVAGIPHFILSLYAVTIAGMGAGGSIFDPNTLFQSDETYAAILIAHFVGIVISTIGGFSGFIAYGLFHGFSDQGEHKNETPDRSNVNSN